MTNTVPEAWHMLPEIHPKQPKKVRVTLLLEEPVAKFYRANGKGYQALINDVLNLKRSYGWPR
ncbi:BrnA antitoxin family protein [Rhodovulum euryhalinum]|nr:BrnA antitoxin family protein [Rhodovulum euryhalinum]